MAAKLVHSWADDDRDLQNQIGCMTGIFQLFDRQHILNGRHVSGHSPKRHPHGSSHFNNSTFKRESNNIYHRPTAEEKTSTKIVNEKQRVSTESPRASLSSSSPSSFFSSPYRFISPETPSRDPSCASPQFGRQSLHLQNRVKDSMHRESWGQSPKTTSKEEPADRAVKHKNFRALSKLREATWRANEAGERPRLSFESKDGSLFSAHKDAPRFSCDESDLSRLSYESPDTFQSTPHLKELPRLSLDSRLGSMPSFKLDSKSNFLVTNSPRDGGHSSNRASPLHPTSGAQTRPSNVVAKLMGLESLPNAASASASQLGLIKTCPVEEYNPFSRSSNSIDPCRPIRTSNLSRNSLNELASPPWKNFDSVMKPISRFPIEPAPWKQVDGNQGSHKSALKYLKTYVRAVKSSPSLYNEIEKRLNDLELCQPGKDLGALKQIVEAMRQDSNCATQKDDEPGYTSPHLSARLVNKQKPHCESVNSSTNRGENSLRTFESQIVTVKPSKLVEKYGVPASSVNPTDRLSGIPKLRGEYADSRNRKSSVNIQQKPKTGSRENAVSSADKHKTINIAFTCAQTSTRFQQLPKLHTTRLQQKKLELQKRLRPPITSDSSKSRRQPNKQQPETGSPGGKRRPKSANSHQVDDRSSDISSETKHFSYQRDGIYMKSDGNIVSELGIDTEVNSMECCFESHGSKSPSTKAAKFSVSRLVKKKLASIFSEKEALAEFTPVASEYPSPVSVLDNTMYEDDSPSPVRHPPDVLKDEQTMNSNDISSGEQWDSAEDPVSNNVDSGKSEINHKKLKKIEHLVQKLRQLNSTHNEAHTDYIASLCETTNPDHRYISEILLASGFLLRVFNSTVTNFQLHSSGHPINPDLFVVLEQTKSSSLRKEESCTENGFHNEKFHRKLIFDAVNEILAGKLASMRPVNLPRKSQNAQKLLRELCSEIDQLQAKESGCVLDNEDDSLKSMLRENVMHQSKNWTDFRDEISGMVLDVERLIFRDLIDDVVHGESAGSQSKPGRHCRQLFA